MQVYFPWEGSENDQHVKYTSLFMYKHFGNLDGHDFHIVKPCSRQELALTFGNVTGNHFQATICLNNIHIWCLHTKRDHDRQISKPIKMAYIELY